jgi:thymidylate kinase
LDYSLQVLYKIFPNIILGKTIVCDRYFYDFLVDQFVNMNLAQGKEKQFYNFFKRIFPEPTKIFYIYTEPKDALQRRSDIPGLEYLIDREKRYSRLAQIDSNWVVIDGNRAKEKVYDEISGIVEGEGIS